MKKTIGVLLVMTFVIWVGYRIIAGIMFDRNCEGYLKRASDSNTVELAKKQLGIAVDYLKRTGKTEGYTSIIYRTPDEDVGFWYSNLSVSLKELEESDPEASQLEKSNLLMKLRETLLDDTSSGISVTVPDGISVFPNNRLVCFIGIVTLVLAIVGVILFLWSLDDY